MPKAPLPTKGPESPSRVENRGGFRFEFDNPTGGAPLNFQTTGEVPNELELKEMGKIREEAQALADQMRSTSRIISGVQMGGEIAGGLAGASAGFAGGGPAGAEIGGATGAMLVRTGIDEIINHFRELGHIRDDKRSEFVSKDRAERMEMAKKVFAFDMAGGTIGTGSQMAAKLIGRRLAGVNLAEAGRVAENARAMNIPLSIQDVAGESKVGLGSGFQKVFGSFPVLASPFRGASKRTASQATEALAKHLDTFAPDHSMASMGLNIRAGMPKGATLTTAEAYDAFRTAAIETGSQVPTDQMRNTSAQVLRSLGNARPIVTSPTGGVAGGERLFREFRAENANALAREISSLKFDTITIDQFANIQQQTRFLMRQAIRQGNTSQAGALHNIGLALERDLENLAGPKRVQEMLLSAKADHFNRVRIYSDGKNVRLHPDDLSLMARLGGEGADAPLLPVEDEFVRGINSSNPEEVIALRKAIGVEKYKVIYARGINRIYSQHTELVRTPAGKNVINLDVPNLKRALGLEGNPDRLLAVRVAHQAATGKRFPEAKTLELLEIIERVQQIQPVDVSAFVARRANLAGIASIKNAITGMGIVGGSATAVGAVGALPMTAALLAGLFGIGKLITNPKALDALLAGGKTGVPAAKASVFMQTAMNALFASEEAASQQIQADFTVTGDDLIQERAAVLEDEEREPFNFQLDSPVNPLLQ